MPASKTQGWFYRDLGAAFFDWVIDGYGKYADVGCCVIRPRLWLSAVRHSWLATVLCICIVPKGFFPVQDTGVILGISEAPQIDFLSRRWSNDSRQLARCDSAGSGRGKPVVLHRHRWNESPP